MYESSNNENGLMWLLTINNPDKQKLTYWQIEDIFRRKTNLKYMCISSEVSSTGTFHYHVFVYLGKIKSFSEIKELIPQAHIDRCNARNPHSIVDYVKKAGKWNETDKKKTQVDGDGAIYECGILPSNERPTNKQWRDYGAVLDELILKVDTILNALTLISHDLTNNAIIENEPKED